MLISRSLDFSLSITYWDSLGDKSLTGTFSDGQVHVQSTDIPNDHHETGSAQAAVPTIVLLHFLSCLLPLYLWIFLFFHICSNWFSNSPSGIKLLCTSFCPNDTHKSAFLQPSLPVPFHPRLCVFTLLGTLLLLTRLVLLPDLQMSSVEPIFKTPNSLRQGVWRHVLWTLAYLKCLYLCTKLSVCF